MLISPFTPLFFSPSKDTSGVPGDFVQTWYMTDEGETDRIVIEVITDDPEIDSVEIVIHDYVRGVNTSQYMRTWEVVDNKKVFFAYLQRMSEGYYDVTIEGRTSNIFRVTSDASEVDDTVLLQFCSKDNKQRTDVAFWIAGLQTFFSWRVPGGFKDDNWQFGVVNEQFVSQHQDIFELYAYETTQKMLTVGDNTGVPIWYGEYLNRILTCNYFYVDGVRYARKESNTPERQSLMEGLRLYSFNQLLQEVIHGNELVEYDNQLALRYTDTNNRTANARTADTSIVVEVDGEQIIVNNPTIAVDYNTRNT